VALLGGVTWLVAARRPHVAVPPPPPAANAKPSPPSSEPAPPPHAPAAATVNVRVMTMPAGADVLFGDETDPRGQTPLLLTLPRGDASERLTVKLKGYEPQSTEVTPDSDSRLMLTLVKSAPQKIAGHEKHHASKHQPPPAVPQAPPPKPPPVPDLHRGDVVDPFK
jgi:hypothetical protein